jgi:chemotaxis signal transduction protein
MSLARPKRVRSTKRGEAMILFAVGPHVFGISASAVDEIRSADMLMPFTPSPRLRVPTVRYTAMRDSKTFFVVDAHVHFGVQPAPVTRVLLLRQSPVALAVGQTHRMTEISALYSLPRAFTGKEREWYRGLALMGEDLVPVINPAALLDEVQVQQLQIACSTERVARGATA